jgi:hypothetical protein
MNHELGDLGSLPSALAGKLRDALIESVLAPIFFLAARHFGPCRCGEPSAHRGGDRDESCGSERSHDRSAGFNVISALHYGKSSSQ